MVRRSSSFNTRAHRSHLRGHRARVRRPRRRLVAEPADAHDPPRRGLQPRRAEPRARQLRRSRVHGRRRRDRHAAAARRDPRGGRARAASTRRRRARCSARSRGAADRGDAVPSAQPVRRRQGVRLLDHAQLPRGVRDVRRQRHPLQPRVAAARAELRHAQDHARGRRDPARRAGRAAPRQPRGEARLGLRAGLHGRRVADAAADEPDDYVLATGETHSVQEFLEEAFALRRPRLARLREDRRALLPARRGRPADRRLLEGEGEARLGADRPLRGARAHDGRRRPRAGQLEEHYL